MLLNPKLSIITIAFNNKHGLIQTMQSVINQNYANIEYIVIDGGSTDGSKEAIEAVSDKLDYWVCEPDSGIYNAMNKGIKNATGDYLLFLNSGDWFANNDVLNTFMQDLEDYDIIYGNRFDHFPDGKIVEEKFDNIVKFDFLVFESALPHQATIIKRKLFNEIGLYDESLKIVSDWKFFVLAIFKYNFKYLHKDISLVNFDMDGIGTVGTYNDIVKKERQSVIDTYFSNFKYLENESLLTKDLLFYYKYSRFLRVLKMLGLIKKYTYPKSVGF